MVVRVHEVAGGALLGLLCLKNGSEGEGGSGWQGWQETKAAATASYFVRSEVERCYCFVISRVGMVWSRVPFFIDRRQVDLPPDPGTEWACGRPGERGEGGGRDVAGVLLNSSVTSFPLRNV